MIRPYNNGSAIRIATWLPGCYGKHLVSWSLRVPEDLNGYWRILKPCLSWGNVLNRAVAISRANFGFGFLNRRSNPAEGLTK